MNINILKAINLDKVLELDEAIALSADVRAFETECETLGVPVPAWAIASGTVIREEIARRTHTADLAEMQRIEREIDGYKSTTERKNDAQRRLSALQKKMGMTAPR